MRYRDYDTTNRTRVPRSSRQRWLGAMAVMAREPRWVVHRFLVPMLRGLRFKLRYLFDPRVSIGWMVMLDCPVTIKGPGRVIIGRKVYFCVNSLQNVTIITTRPESTVRIGSGSNIGGLRILCADSVTIGRHCLFARSYISDIDFVDDPPESAEPVVVGDHCWLSGSTGLLKNSTLGHGSTLGLGSVLSSRTVGDRYLVAGRPARPVMKIVG